MPHANAHSSPSCPNTNRTPIVAPFCHGSSKLSPAARDSHTLQSVRSLSACCFLHARVKGQPFALGLSKHIFTVVTARAWQQSKGGEGKNTQNLHTNTTPNLRRKKAPTLSSLSRCLPTNRLLIAH